MKNTEMLYNKLKLLGITFLYIFTYTMGKTLDNYFLLGVFWTLLLISLITVIIALTSKTFFNNAVQGIKPSSLTAIYLNDLTKFEQISLNGIYVIIPIIYGDYFTVILATIYWVLSYKLWIKLKSELNKKSKHKIR
jgi:hypothetical protein